MFSIQPVSYNPLIATFQLSYAACLNLGWSQNGVLGNNTLFSIITHKKKGFKNNVVREENAQNSTFSIPKMFCNLCSKRRD